MKEMTHLDPKNSVIDNWRYLKFKLLTGETQGNNFV